MAAGLDDKGQPTTKTSPLTEQTIAVGPAASQIAIKQLGTNGGGFFNVNSAHPFENPTPLSQLPRAAGDPADLRGTVLHVRRDGRRHAARLGRAGGHAGDLRAAVGCVLLGRAERQLRRWPPSGVDQAGRATAGRRQHGRQGSPLRHRQLGAVGDGDHAASNGSVNSMHDSYTPLGGLVPMWLMQLGEVVFGGVGSGLYGMLVFAIIAVFVAGLMVGRTPEYLGKKIEAFEMKMAALVILIPPLVVLVGTAVAVAIRTWSSRAFPTRARTASAKCSTPSPRPATTTAARSPG